MRQQVGFWVNKLDIVQIWQLHPCVQTFEECVLKSRREELKREESVDMGNGASDLATLRRIIQPSVDIITPACLMASFFSLRWRLVMNAIVVFEFVTIWRNFLLQFWVMSVTCLPVPVNSLTYFYLRRKRAYVPHPQMQTPQRRCFWSQNGDSSK